MSQDHSERFSSGGIALIALFGFTLSFGAIWRFPYIAGENGAGSFLLVYVFCLILFAIPLQMGALMIGRRGRGDPVNAIRSVCEQGRSTTFWVLIGALGLLAALIVLSYFSVISGWIISYLYFAGSGQLAAADATASNYLFTGLLDDWKLILACHSLFMAMTVAVSAAGPRRGLQPVFVICAVVVLVSLAVLFFAALNTGAVWDSLRFQLWGFEKMGDRGGLVAIGQAFYVVGVGTGAVLALGAHMPSTASITKISLFSAIAVFLVSIFAGVTMFALVFGSGLEPAAGPGLIFMAVPTALSYLPGGTLYVLLFFTMMLAIAWGTSIGFMEPLVMWTSRTLNTSRSVSAVIVGVAAWVLGLLSAFSFNLLSGATVDGMSPFDLLDYLSSNILIPLGAFLLAIFAAFGISRYIAERELRIGAAHTLWQVLAGILAPIAIVAMVINLLI